MSVLPTYGCIHARTQAYTHAFARVCARNLNATQRHKGEVPGWWLRETDILWLNVSRMGGGGGGKKHEITITVIVTAYSVIFDYSRSVKYSGRSWIDPPGSLLHREESYPFSRVHRPLARRVMQVRFRNSAIRARRHSRGSHFYSYDRPRQF